MGLRLGPTAFSGLSPDQQAALERARTAGGQFGERISAFESQFAQQQEQQQAAQEQRATPGVQSAFSRLSRSQGRSSFGPAFDPNLQARQEFQSERESLFGALGQQADVFRQQEAERQRIEAAEQARQEEIRRQQEAEAKAKRERRERDRALARRQQASISTAAPAQSFAPPGFNPFAGPPGFSRKPF